MNKVLIVDDSREITKALIKLLSEAEPYVISANNYIANMNNNNFTPDREHGWYRKFEKNGKKRNFKKAI